MKKLADHVQEQNPDIDMKAWQEKIKTFIKKVFDNFNGKSLLKFFY
jgi:hypothetical protein